MSEPDLYVINGVICKHDATTLKTLIICKIISNFVSVNFPETG